MHRTMNVYSDETGILTGPFTSFVTRDRNDNTDQSMRIGIP